ncbi:MAG: hypothetical protein IPI35_35545 [Deltaproteobacteria bacterium]|nr:hypothetical protein [Deltaproteobacteria bacterium]
MSCAAALRPGTSELVTALTPRGDTGATTTLSRWVNGVEQVLCLRPTRRAGVAALNELFFPTPSQLMALGAKDAVLVELETGALRDDVRAYRVTSSGLALVEEAAVLDLNTGARLLLPSGILRTPKVLGASSTEGKEGGSARLGGMSWCGGASTAHPAGANRPTPAPATPSTSARPQAGRETR